VSYNPNNQNNLTPKNEEIKNDITNGIPSRYVKNIDAEIKKKNNTKC